MHSASVTFRQSFHLGGNFGGEGRNVVLVLELLCPFVAHLCLAGLLDLFHALLRDVAAVCSEEIHDEEAMASML